MFTLDLFRRVSRKWYSITAVTVIFVVELKWHGKRRAEGGNLKVDLEVNFIVEIYVAMIVNSYQFSTKSVSCLMHG